MSMMNNMTWTIMKISMIQKRSKHALCVARTIVVIVGTEIKKLSKARSFILNLLASWLKKRYILWKRSKN
jgi:hypothetical protein